MIERRRHARNPARQRAFIVLPEPVTPIPCTIRETSPFGSLIEYRQAADLPQSFHLLLDGTQLLPCRLVRRASGEAGVEYLRRAS